MTAAGSSFFCGTGELMRRNGQAGRWSEVAPLLRFGLHVLISDADISWLRDPRPYFREVRRKHPQLDFLLCTDRAFNGYMSEPLVKQRLALARPARSSQAARSPLERMPVSDRQADRALAHDLDLEDGEMAAIPSYNIGILMLYAHAASNLSAMIDILWVEAVTKPVKDRRTGKSERMVGGLASWDQGPINTRVLHGRQHPLDSRLVLIDRALPSSSNPWASTDRKWQGPRIRLAMGVLPMLQFATAFTFYIKADLRLSLGARPYSLHAIYSHGHDHLRKKSLLREAIGWVDSPDYYGGEAHRYLVYNASPSERARRFGGFELILSQLKHFEMALRVASLANRTLILPRLQCGAAAMAYPCYAWYHRAMTSSGFRHDAVPMPEFCPTYYWLNHELARTLRIPLRESTFLENPRTPQRVKASRATLHFCPEDSRATANAAGSGGRSGGSGGGGSGSGSQPCDALAARPQGSSSTGRAKHATRPAVTLDDAATEWDGSAVVMPAHTSVARLSSVLSSLASVRVLHIADLAALSLEGAARVGPLVSDRRLDRRHTAGLGGGLHEVSPLSAGFWCNPCVITRRGGVIQEVNRSVVRELEKNCRVEARGNLGYPGSRQTCCAKIKTADGCPFCRPGQRPTRNASTLSVHMAQYLPVWANLQEPRELGRLDALGRAASNSEPEANWRCLHPLCTAADPDRFP